MRYLLVDGGHLAGRSRAAMKDLITRSGKRSGTIHGFLRGLSYVRKQLNIGLSEVLVCWDGGHSEERLKLYPEYKAGRIPENPTVEEAEERKQYIQQLCHLTYALQYLGIPQIHVAGVEADDLVGIMATFYSHRGDRPIILSGDHDMHQLISTQCDLWDPKKELQTLDDILRRWELPDTDQVLLYKAIVGDNSDNISGINGVGDKRARVILSRMSRMDIHSDPPRFWTNLLNIDEKDLKWVDKFDANLDIIIRNIKLMRIPRTWDEAPYKTEQKVECLEQLLAPIESSDEKFVQFCSEWELEAVLRAYS